MYDESFRGSFTFDLRGVFDKDKKSFRQAVNIWQVEPQTVHTEEVETAAMTRGSFFSIVHDLPKQQRVLHIVTTGDATLDFVFYDSCYPYRRRGKRLQVEGDDRAMVVKDLRPVGARDESRLLVAVQHWHGCKLVSLTFDAEPSGGSSDGQDAPEVACTESGTYTADGDLVDCFLVQDGVLVLMLSRLTIVTDLAFARPAAIETAIGCLRCCCPVQGTGAVKFWMGYETTDRTLMARLTQPHLLTEQEQLPENAGFEGSEGNDASDSFLTRFTFDAARRHLEQYEPKSKKAIYLQRKLVNAVYEYAQDRLIVATKISLLLFHDSVLVRVYQDFCVRSSVGNSFAQKYGYPVGCFCPLPGFDLGKFPFLVCQGSQAVTLINVGQPYAVDLILTGATCRYGQQAFYFSEEEDGCSLNFAVSRTRDATQLRFEWVKMPFRTDLLTVLRSASRLPDESVKKQLRDFREARMLRRMKALHERQQDREAQAEKLRIIKETRERISAADAEIYEKSIRVREIASESFDKEREIKQITARLPLRQEQYRKVCEAVEAGKAAHQALF